jgi:hypothetical protein
VTLRERVCGAAGVALLAVALVLAAAGCASGPTLTPLNDPSENSDPTAVPMGGPGTHPPGRRAPDAGADR